MRRRALIAWLTLSFVAPFFFIAWYADGDNRRVFTQAPCDGHTSHHSGRIK